MEKYKEELARLQEQKKELREAINAGRQAQSIADEVLSKLKSAKGWGVCDLLGGGLISDIAKHSALDEAQELVEHLKNQLRRFKTELADVSVQADLQVQINGFTRFADYFFDGIFADWTVLDRIERSVAQAEKLQMQIKEVLEWLSAMEEQVEKKEKQLFATDKGETI